MQPEFDRYAPSYADLLDDPIRNGFITDPLDFHRRKLAVIVNCLERIHLAPSNLKWLDVGCGKGELLRLGSSSFKEAAGCDPSPGMISECAPVPMHVQPSPAELPFESNSFDFVTAVCVYHHVHGKTRTQLTDAIHRVLRPGGIFCMIEHNPWNPATRLIVKRCPVDADAALLGASSACSLVRSSSFDVLVTDYFLYLPQKVFRYAGALERSLRKLPVGGQYAMFCRKNNPVPLGSPRW